MDSFRHRVAEGYERKAKLKNAIRKGDVASVRMHFDSRNVNQLLDHKSTHLAVAVEANNEEIVKFFLAHGADVNGGIVPALHAAAGKGYPNMVKLLISSGADVNLCLEGLGTPLLSAAKAEPPSVEIVEIVRYLLELGAQPNLQDGEGPSPLIAAARYRPPEEAIIRLLLHHNADVNAKSVDGTALQVAAYWGSENLMKMLLDNGADPNGTAIYPEQGRALTHAAASGSRSSVELLIKAGADVNARDILWGSALQAAAANNPECLMMLIEAGADVNAQGGRYGNALQALIAANDNPQIEWVKCLIDHEADVTIQPLASRESLLHAAAGRANSEVLTFLLKKGADTHIESQDGEGYTPLHCAVERQNLDAVCILLDFGSSPDAEIFSGTTCVQLSAQSPSCNPEIVKELYGRSNKDLSGICLTTLRACSGLQDQCVLEIIKDPGNGLAFKDLSYIETLQKLGYPLRSKEEQGKKSGFPPNYGDFLNHYARRRRLM